MTIAERVNALANELYNEWDHDNDMRVGKLLMALLGEIPGYRNDIDELLKDLEAVDGESK